MNRRGLFGACAAAITSAVYPQQKAEALEEVIEDALPYGLVDNVVAVRRLPDLFVVNVEDESGDYDWEVIGKALDEVGRIIENQTGKRIPFLMMPQGLCLHGLHFNGEDPTLETVAEIMEASE